MPKPRPILERIDAALAKGPISYAALAHAVFPDDQFPRAWRYATGGGPPGCYMALSAALRRGGYHRGGGLGPGNEKVYPRQKEKK